jgi:hypothetical protein
LPVVGDDAIQRRIAQGKNHAHITYLLMQRRRCAAGHEVGASAVARRS